MDLNAIKERQVLASVNPTLHVRPTHFLVTEDVPALCTEVDRLRSAIRKHRDQRGDDRCWLDDRELYAVLPEGYEPLKEDSCVELERCRKFIASRHDPATDYISPQRRIDELTLEVNRLRRVIVTAKELIVRIGTTDVETGSTIRRADDWVADLVNYVSQENPLRPGGSDDS